MLFYVILSLNNVCRRQPPCIPKYQKGTYASFKLCSVDFAKWSEYQISITTANNQEFPNIQTEQKNICAAFSLESIPLTHLHIRGSGKLNV